MSPHEHDHPDEHAHPHPHEHGHGHMHGVVDPSLVENPTTEGIRTVQISLVILGITAAIQVVIVLASGSVALLADTVHNIGDALTAVPLWIAFSLSRRPPSRTFTYGLGRAEDLAGLAVVLLILFSALYAGYEAIDRLVHPRTLSHLGAIAAAAVIGFVGNEVVAAYRIRTGRRIGSAALVADGYHARTDGLTSLAVLGGAIGVWLGFGIADPLIGLTISVVILRIVWSSAKSVLTRALDGVEPEAVEQIRDQATQVAGVREVAGVRARWNGHRLHADLDIAVDPDLPASAAHEVAVAVRHRLLHGVPHLGEAVVHVDPATASGALHHRIEGHIHDGLPQHAHS